jgi:hypothetical protein
MLKYPEIVKSYTFVNPDTGDSKSFDSYKDFYDCLQEYKKAENEKECGCQCKKQRNKQTKKLRFNL